MENRLAKTKLMLEFLSLERLSQYMFSDSDFFFFVLISSSKLTLSSPDNFFVQYYIFAPVSPSLPPSF